MRVSWFSTSSFFISDLSYLSFYLDSETFRYKFCCYSAESEIFSAILSCKLLFSRIFESSSAYKAFKLPIDSSFISLWDSSDVASSFLTCSYSYRILSISYSICFLFSTTLFSVALNYSMLSFNPNFSSIIYLRLSPCLCDYSALRVFLDAFCRAVSKSSFF